MKRTQNISLNWTRLVLNEKPENGVRHVETISSLRSTCFPSMTDISESRMFALEQNFAVKRKKMRWNLTSDN